MNITSDTEYDLLPFLSYIPEKISLSTALHVGINGVREFEESTFYGREGATIYKSKDWVCVVNSDNSLKYYENFPTEDTYKFVEGTLKNQDVRYQYMGYFGKQISTFLMMISRN